MAISIMTVNGKIPYNTYEYICDFEKDIQQLPTNCMAGSKAYIIETGKIYVINNLK